MSTAIQLSLVLLHWALPYGAASLMLWRSFWGLEPIPTFETEKEWVLCTLLPSTVIMSLLSSSPWLVQMLMPVIDMDKLLSFLPQARICASSWLKGTLTWTFSTGVASQPCTWLAWPDCMMSLHGYLPGSAWLLMTWRMSMESMQKPMRSAPVFLCQSLEVQGHQALHAHPKPELRGLLLLPKALEPLEALTPSIPSPKVWQVWVSAVPGVIAVGRIAHAQALPVEDQVLYMLLTSLKWPIAHHMLERKIRSFLGNCHLCRP